MKVELNQSQTNSIQNTSKNKGGNKKDIFEILFNQNLQEKKEASKQSTSSKENVLIPAKKLVELEEKMTNSKEKTAVKEAVNELLKINKLKSNSSDGIIQLKDISALKKALVTMEDNLSLELPVKDLKALIKKIEQSTNQKIEFSLSKKESSSKELPLVNEVSMNKEVKNKYSFRIGNLEVDDIELDKNSLKISDKLSGVHNVKKELEEVNLKDENISTKDTKLLVHQEVSELGNKTLENKNKLNHNAKIDDSNNLDINNEQEITLNLKSNSLNNKEQVDNKGKYQNNLLARLDSEASIHSAKEEDIFSELKKHRLELDSLEPKHISHTEVEHNNWQVTSEKKSQLKLDDWVDTFKQEIDKLADFRIENKQKVSMLLKEQDEQLRILVEKKDTYILIEAKVTDKMMDNLNIILAEIQSEMKEKGIEVKVDIKQDQDNKKENNDSGDEEKEKRQNNQQQQGGQNDDRQHDQSAK
ncbi:hypothetical protein P4679_26275 [Priestia megaterium]|uniref:hypothetical protein n=1 Tax=Priestia megaterium TaxID=1404 RepID=UPI002E1AAA7E|nr:hypothetical protein [Priestia megaterium]